MDKFINNPLSGKEKNSVSRFRLLTFILEISLIVFLLVVWFSSKSVKSSHHLLVLFFYSFPSQFLIAIVPHEPVFVYFSKFYPPLTISLVAIAGTLLTELLNYSVFKFVVDLAKFSKIQYGSFIKKVVELFNKTPFIALLVAGFTPIPFYPFRFLVVLAKYPVQKYLLAVFLSRSPRFYLLALLGNALKIPDYLLLILFIFLVIIANIPIIKELIKKKQTTNLANKPDFH